jgi:hypothetical protein
MGEASVELARMKNALFCLWVGTVFGVAALFVTGFWRAVAVVMLVSISCYLQVGRRTLGSLAVPAILFGIWALFDVHVTWNDIRNAAGQFVVIQ